MRNLLLSGIALLATAVPALAQTSLGGGGLTTGSLGSLAGGSSGLGASTLGGSGLGGTGSIIGGTSSSSTGGSFLGATAGTSTGRTGGGAQTVGSTSPFGVYYGEPRSLGIAGNNGTLPTNPTFGVPLYSVTGIGSTSGGSTFGGLAGAGGSTGGSAIATTGTVNATSYGIRRVPSYYTELGFDRRITPPTQVQANLQQMYAHTSRLSTPGAIRVDVDGQVVVLRGTVANDRERRLAESLARLTPGVHDIRNELGVRSASASSAP
jgi:hypothetical protein